MTFDELLVQVRELLQSKGRVSYRALKLQFNLDEEHLEGLKDELIEAERVAADEDGKVLVWVRASSVQSSESRVPSSPQSLAPNPQPLAERRQLTVMFCDLVGSTALSAQLDPEELREVVRAYQETCTIVIRRYDGHVAQHLGDGLLVYFGYPQAHEDDAQRAVRVGLDILADLQPLNAQLSPTIRARLPHPMQVRIGVHTGLVVIGEIGSTDKREILALGETPNIAARVQGIAQPDTVVISAVTYRLIEGLFACEDRGQPELKGVSTPLTLYRVIKEGEAQSRFQVVVRKGLTPLIGRAHEYGLLRERWEQAKSGEGQVVLLSGEPGIGKSRLVEALKESVEHEGASCLELRCSPYHQNSALYPVITHMQRVLRFQSGDNSEEKLRELAQALAEQADTPVIASAAKQSLPETEIASSPAAPRNDNAHLLLFAALLSLPHPEGYPPITLSPQKQKEKTHEALVAWLCAEAKQQAVVYGWEDLHWADPSTLELLTLFLNQVPTTRLLTVLTFRPEFTPPWDRHSYLSQLTLSRLGRTHVETMVEKVTGGQILPQEVVQQIVSKTDGIPLFVEELTKTVIESIGSSESIGSGERLGRSPLPLGIPATLQDALMARLDRLGPAKEIAQVGAMIGREFDYALLHAVSPLNEEALQQGLKQLVESELVYLSGVPPQARYLFKHALVQKTAYQSLLKSRRQQLHHQVARLLVDQFPDTIETQPELAAHHYTEAGQLEQAIPYWQQAGQRATERSANTEAISHLTKGLELLQILPDTPERAQRELTLQIALGGSLMAIKGYAAPEAGKAYARARELCRQVGETPQLFFVLGGLAGFYIIRGELRTGRELIEQCLSLAQSLQHPALLQSAHYALGEVLFDLGELLQARTHLELAITLYDPQKRRLRAFHDTGVACLSNAAFTLWSLGYPDQALQRIRESLTLAQELSHPFSLAFALYCAAALYQRRREVKATQEQAEALITLSHEHGFTLREASGVTLRGWALAEQGREEEGIAQIRQGLAATQATGADLFQPYFLALLADAYGKGGQVEEGLTVLAEALVAVDKTGARYYESELYRLKGELTLQQFKVQSSKFKVEEAEECFLKAVEIARQQQAKSLELRAATSLARLWQQQSKQKEDHQMLAEIYNWFTEGFDTKDLQEAKALLEDLGEKAKRGNGETEERRTS